MSTTRVLVVDDDRPIREAIEEIFAESGLEVHAVQDGEAALRFVNTLTPDIVLLDVKLPGKNGLEIFPRLQKCLPPGTPIIILTGADDAATAVRAMRLGAYDYVTKPFRYDDLRARVERAVKQRMRGAPAGLRRRQGADALAEQMGESPQVQRVIEQVRQVAASNVTVLIQGETGTGKELIARAIHQLSPRNGHPFVALDCGAIPETLTESELFGYERGAFTGADRHKDGHFRLADHGTLFLDELANLPVAAQVKLLRALEDRTVRALGGERPTPVDVRIIGACNTCLEAEVRRGRFRQDLYYRLSEFTIKLPPLRERASDILHLATRFLGEAALEMQRAVYGFTQEAEALLILRPWPGNVRELRNVVRRAVLTASKVIGLDDLTGGESPDPLHSAPLDSRLPAVTLREARDQAVANAESQVIRWALRETGGNKAAAARLLKVDYKTLWYKIQHYGLGDSDTMTA
jgi:DNA-binding NtrC family response regulator